MAAKIKPDQLYEYGVLTRASESSGDVETNPVYPGNMRNWPRQVQGQYFIDKGVTTFEEYLATNPERLDLNRILFFYEVDRDGHKKRVHSGNLTHMPPATTPLVQSTTAPMPSNGYASNLDGGNGPWPSPLSDPAAVKPSPMLVQPGYPQQPEHSPYNVRPMSDPVRTTDFHETNATRQRVLDLQSEVNELRSKINERDAEINRLRGEIEGWRSKAFEAERRELNAMADLKVIQQTKQAELDAMRKEHESQITFLSDKHKDSMEIMQIKAISTAKEQMALNDGPDEDFAEKLGDLLPKLTPLLTPFIKLAEAGVDHLTRKWTNGAPVNMPSPQQQAYLQQQAMQQAAQQPAMVDPSEVPSSQMPDYELPPGMPQ